MHFRPPLAVALLAALAALEGCANRSPLLPASSPPAEASWIELGPDGVAQARAVVRPGSGCPVLQLDDHASSMTLRAPAVVPGASAEGRAAAGFDISVCEAALPAGIHAASIAGRRLPLPAARVDRLVVIGDTGCRIKNTELQDCNPQSWPFAAVAEGAARRKPDLVIHVGDYHYREGPCPSGAANCQSSPLGYGWNVWNVDFFKPAAPLLAAAPWIMVRGNHEECRRAGQGWFRLLAPEPWQAARTCNDPAQDGVADYSAPYALPLGGGLQLLVFDSAHAGNLPLDSARPGDALTLATYEAQMREIATLAARSPRNWFVSHHPVLGYAPDAHHPGNAPLPGNAALQQAMRPVFGTQWYPDGVKLALHGHVHLFQALDFSSGQPATLVAGNGGDLLDTDLSATIDAGPAEGVTVARITHASRFGYLWMEREDEAGMRWKVEAWRVDGSLLTQCTLEGSRLECDPAGALH